MYERFFRIHGDNIVECERVINFLAAAASLIRCSTRLVSAGVLEIDTLLILPSGQQEKWVFQLFPGFNKSKRKRWNRDIFDTLRTAGGFLDETPDAILTSHDRQRDQEVILCALEFCSALQAGNQAWQRSGRAYSTNRAACPYLYIVDFVKYELTRDRERKSLRMPNPIVPFSYIATTQESTTLCAEVFVKAEEFDADDDALKTFDESWFGEKDLGLYLLNLMLGRDTRVIEKLILDKNLKLVQFFAKQDGKKAFSSSDWQRVFEKETTLTELCIEKAIPWKKKSAAKSESSLTTQFIKLCAKYAVSIGSNDLPFALIPKHRVQAFKDEVELLGATHGLELLQQKITDTQDLVVCLVKGFKPRGDDARPDRGILPLVRMLLGEEVQVLTYIYGPMTRKRFDALRSNPAKVTEHSGFWKVFLSLSNVILIDSPEIGVEHSYLTGYISLDEGARPISPENASQLLSLTAIDKSPLSLHEDDVDTVIHAIITALPDQVRFEGLCNPPGGDWSGLSLLDGEDEIRWLSLPRVSGEIGGKRPDHVIQLFPEEHLPVTLSIESKEHSNDLEPNVGNALKQYLYYLAGFVPSVIRRKQQPWGKDSTKHSLEDAKILSAAAFIYKGEDLGRIFLATNCQIMLALTRNRTENYWDIKVHNFGASDKEFAVLRSVFEQGSPVEGVVLNFQS